MRNVYRSLSLVYVTNVTNVKIDHIYNCGCLLILYRLIPTYAILNGWLLFPLVVTKVHF